MSMTAREKSLGDGTQLRGSPNDVLWSVLNAKSQTCRLEASTLASCPSANEPS